MKKKYLLTLRADEREHSSWSAPNSSAVSHFADPHLEISP